MYNRDTELLFPPRLILSLAGMRGEHWRELAERVDGLEPDNPERAAFVLMMSRLASCLTCHADSYRALRGCTVCAAQTMRRYRGSDIDLLNLFNEAHVEVKSFLGAAKVESKGNNKHV